MNETQFIQLGQEILNQIQCIRDISEASNLLPKLAKIQKYILDNPDKECVKNFIVTLLKPYIDLFFKKELIEAFNISEQFHYYKQIQVYINLPYTLCPLYAYYLPKILVVPSDIYGNFYKTFLWALQQYYPNIATSFHIQTILDFINQNESIIHGSKDKYYSLTVEKDFYHSATNGFHFKELEEFSQMKKIYNANEIQRAFINKKIGNIGELYVYELIKPHFTHCFVSRDVKDGFGYDVFFFDNEGLENLVEVKTTMNSGGEDFFTMSENEYSIMKNCFYSASANYYICRVQLDYLLNFSSYVLLTMKDAETLINAEKGIEYKLFQLENGNFYFKKTTQKKKIK